MEFKATKGIFLQIADNLCSRILEDKLPPGERIPSVRDLAGELEVNRNTVMRTYTYLENMGIIENKRGVGFYVVEEATTLIRDQQKKEFFENELPALLEKIRLLKMNSNDLKQIITEIKNND